MSDVLHEKYTVDENGKQAGVILDLSEFVRLLKAAGEGDSQYRITLEELGQRNIQLREALEELEDLKAFERALAAPAEDQESVPFDQATAEIENARK